jgi:alkanesulfonate monooxygenase SsuD/methylene tetrahydromethanopterin reductase-like flavin-dependent oxidoreductase (luciferase family)
MALEFGLFYEIPVPRPWTARSERDAYHAVVAQAVRGEEVGFTHFWTVEHHFLDEFSHCSSPEVLYGAVAAKTSTIKIGHGVRLLPVPYNHPLRVAEMAATLDCLSDGRVEFGTGRSSTRPELEGFGIDPDDTRGMWEEALDVVVGAWTNDLFEHHGKYFHVPPRRVHPKPLQQPHPPLWVASTSPDSHALAGRKGLGLLSFTIGVPPEELAARIQLYRDGLAEMQQPVGKVANRRAATFTMVHCAETNAEARANAAESVVWYLQHSTKLIGTLATWQMERQRDLGTYAYAQMLRDLDLSHLTFDVLDEMGAVIVGDPARCIERVRRYQAAGCDQLLCLMNPFNIPPDKVMRSIELFGLHVIPSFR